MAIISTPEAYREYLRKKKETEQNQSSASQTTTHKTARTIGTPEEYKKYLAEKNGTAAVKTDEEKALDRAAFRSTVEKTLPSNRAYGNQVRIEVSNAVKAARDAQVRSAIDKTMPERKTYRQMVERDIASTAARRAVDAQIKTEEERRAAARTAQQEYERIFREESDEDYVARMSGYTQMNGIPEAERDMLASAMKRDRAEMPAANAAKSKIDDAQAVISSAERRIDTLNKEKAALEIENRVQNNLSRETGGSAVSLTPGKVIANAVNGTNKVVLGELDRGITALVPMMTDAEKETVRKLAAGERWADIEAYADAIKPRLNERQIQAQMQRVDELPKVGQVAYGLTNTFATPGAYAQVAADAIKGENTDLNAGLVGQSRVSGYARAKSLENLSDTGKFLGNVGYSMADNLISMALGETGALVWLGLSAAGNSATDVLSRGGSQKQALIQGTASGITETATEKIGMDNLFGVAKTMGKAGVKNVLKTIAKQGLAEGAEEVISEFAGAIVGIVNMGGDSEYRQLIKQLKEQGYSEKDAVHMANYQTFVTNPKLAGLAGAVSGALFGAGGAAISGVRTAQYAKGIREAGEVRALIDEGLKLDPTSDGYKLAQKFESDMRVRGDTIGSTISSGELVELEQALPREAIGRIAAEAVNRLSAEAQTRRAAGPAIQEEETAVQAEQTPARTEQIDVQAEQTPAQRNAQEADAAPTNGYTAAQPASTSRPASASRRGERTELTPRQARRILLEQKRDAHAVSFINDIAQEAGVHVKYYEQIDGDNGYYDNGTIWVNLSGADKNPINVVFRHEMIHTIKETNKTAYDGLRSYVIDSADTVALEGQRAKMREQYARAGVAFDEDVFADEMVARLGERVLTDNDVALAMAKRNPSSARGVLGWIKQTLRRLYRIGARNQMNQFYRFDEVMKPEDLYSKENLSRVRTLLENALGSTVTGSEITNVSEYANAAALKSIRTGFDAEFSKWLDSTNTQEMKESHGYFKLGMTSDVLRGLGAKNVEVFWRKSKIGYILDKHENIDGNILKKVPADIIENPVMILKSNTQENSIVLMGTLDTKKGTPIMASMSLQPEETGSLRGEFNLITSVYDRPEMENLIRNSEVLYLDKNENRTEARLMQLRVQFPSGQPTLGSIGTISYANGNVKLQGKYIFAKNDMNERSFSASSGPSAASSDAQGRKTPSGNNIAERNGKVNTKTETDARRSVPTGAVYQTPEEQAKSGKLTDPTEKESYKQMQADDSSATAEETNGTLQKVAPLLIPGTAKSHVGASKDLSRNLDIAAGKSEAVRRVLRQQLEVPLYNAKKQYVADYKSMLSQLREHTVELGIRPHSEESAAVMWIGEGQRLLSPKGQQSPPGTKRWHRGAKYETVSYTLEQLKKDFPERAANGRYVWENIVECERWMRATYNEYVDRINATLEEIYPDVLGRAEADLAALEAEIAKYENLTNVEGQTADLRRLQENADAAARELGAYRKDPNASSDALRELVDRIQEERYAYSRRGRLDTKAAEEQLARIKNLEARYESMRTSEEQRLADAEANARNRYERARAKEQAGREGRLSRNQSIIREKKEAAERLRQDIESGAIYKNKRLIPRKDYFHHYMEQQQSGFFSDLIGMTQGSAQIDPELIGKSENTQPNTRFTGFMQKRMGGRYVEDAVSGMIQYIPKAEYKINIEKIIPHYRAAVRDIALATKDTKNANQLVDWLIAFTNDLAGKTNRIDRFILGMFGDERGRTVLTALEKATNRLKANAVTLNFGSALVQISNLSNVLSYVKDPKAFAVGAYDASRLLLGGKEQQEIRNKSVFLSERYLEKDLAAFAVTFGEKLENFSGAMLRIGDESVATLGWFTLYRQGIRQNMTQDEAIYYADDYTRRAIGGRGIGEIPLAQKARLTKLIAPFQVEVQNTWNLLMEKGMRKPDAAGLIVYFVSNFLLNLVLDAFGKSSGLDILGALADICRIWGMQLPGDDEKKEDDKTTQEKLLASGQRLAGEVVSALPMANEILPTVLTDETFRKSLFGENDPTRYGTGTMLARAIEQPLEDAFAGNNVDILSPALNFLMPMGGKQLERSIRSLQSYGVLPQANIKARRGGSSFGMQEIPASYTDKGSLRFTIDTKDPVNVAAGLLLGVYNTKEGKAYSAAGAKPKSAAQTQMAEIARKLYGLPDMDTAEAMAALSKMTATKDASGKEIKSAKQNKKEYIRGLNIPEEQKVGLYNLFVESGNLSISRIYGSYKAYERGGIQKMKAYIRALDVEDEIKEKIWAYMKKLVGGG